MQAGANSQLLPRLRHAPAAASARLQQTTTVRLDWRELTLRGSVLMASIAALLAAGVLYMASHDPHAAPDLLTGTLVGGLFALTMGTFAILVRRLRNAIDPTRRMMMPIVLASGASALLLACFIASERAGLAAADVFGAAYVATVLAVPLGISHGLHQERLFLGEALADLVGRLSSDSGRADVERAIADALHDPTLTVLYRHDRDTYVDGEGAPVDVLRESRGRSVVRIDVEGRPAAIVLFDRELRHQRRFVEAAGEAALLWLDKARLETELLASMHDLEVSRRRLLDAAVSERQRIQRDLHDSAQQHLVGMRVKLGLAQSSLGRDQSRTERLLAGVQSELESALQEVRSLANGVYPAVLTQYGLAGALKAACRRASMPVSLQTHGLTRYARDIEGAIYFTCVEALQNSEKHAGRHVQTTVHVWQDRERVRFAVRDSGTGFDRSCTEAGTGLLSMRDRIEAVGGTLAISSAPGAGTIVSGEVPLRSARRRLRQR